MLDEKCSTCVFRPGNLMHLGEGRLQDLVESNRDAGSALTCHKTLPYGNSPEAGEAVCRGYYDAFCDRPESVLFLAKRIGIVREVELI